MKNLSIFPVVAGAMIVASAALAVDQLQHIGQMVAKLTGEPRKAAQTWVDRIQKEQSANPVLAKRLVAEIHTALAVVTEGQAPGTSKAWAGLTHTAQDLLPVDDLNTVELVEKGILAGGSQPANGAWDLIKRKGYKTIVNLRAEDNSEAAKVKALGLNPVHIPVVSKGVPTEAQAKQFVALVNDPKNRPVFVHDHRGADRTHTMIAVWRVAQKVKVEEALAEAAVWGMGSIAAQVEFVKKFALTVGR